MKCSYLAEISSQTILHGHSRFILKCYCHVLSSIRGRSTYKPDLHFFFFSFLFREKPLLDIQYRLRWCNEAKLRTIGIWDMCLQNVLMLSGLVKTWLHACYIYHQIWIRRITTFLCCWMFSSLQLLSLGFCCKSYGLKSLFCVSECKYGLKFQCSPLLNNKKKTNVQICSLKKLKYVEVHLK